MTNQNNKMRKFFLYIILVLIGHTAMAQEKDLVSADFYQSTLEDVAKQIEAQTDYRVFFDQDKLKDSTRFTLKAENVHLNSLLDKLFSNTDLTYSIDRNKNIFITKGTALTLNLPPGYWHGNEPLKPETISVKEKKGIVQPVVVSSTIENRIIEIGSPSSSLKGGRASIAGYVRNAESGEELSGVTVTVENTKVQVATDQFGYFSLLLSPGRYIIDFTYMGMFDTRRQVRLFSDGKLDVDMKNKIIQLKEVVIESEKERNIRSTNMGLERLNISTIKQIPAVMGEVDVLRAVLSLPGVKSVGEASTGMNVRGGATDQNLILFNDANIYNPSHLFGFFSAIDPDVIKNVNLYKSSIPAEYGGRVSSVLDITSLDGNTKKLSGSAGLGVLTSKISLNGPIVKDKTTFVFGARSTYSDWIFKLLPQDYKDSKASFYDGTIHISHKMSAKDQLYLNGYISKDKLALNADTRFAYKNINGNLKWKHNFNSRFYMVLLGGVDHYDYETKDSTYVLDAYQLKYRIDQYKANLDFSYFLNNKHSLSFGASSILYRISPGSLSPWDHSLRTADTLQREQGLESAVYLSDQFNVSEKLSMEGGLRFTMYNFLGPQTVNEYASGLPVTMDNLVGMKNYPAGKMIKSFMMPDVRYSIRYMITEKFSAKASFNTLHQFIHQISNTAAVTPTDIWKLSDTHIKPQSGSQVAFGLYRNFKNNTIETSLEVYYKWLKNYLDYKSGATLLMNHHLETDVFNTEGKAYGVEFLVKKPTGKMNGWFSYNYSRSEIRQNDPLAGELINEGKYYPTNFDQPHNATFIGNYKFSHRVSVSLNMTYSTGRPITLPIGVYNYNGAPRVLYSDRNAYRIPDYFRTDFSLNIDGNHKVHQLTHNSWTLGLYNATGRRNAYSVYFVTEDGTIKGYKLSVFGTIIPYITFNIRF